MASLLGEQLFEMRGQGPPALGKDYYQLVISKSEVIWRSWTISLRSRGAPPKEEKVSHQDFPQNKTLQHNIEAVLGQRILDYTIMICSGVFDYLERLPDDILLIISSHLELKDAAQLSQVSKRFREFYNSERHWEMRVRALPEFTSDMEQHCRVVGWRKSFLSFVKSWQETKKRE